MTSFLNKILYCVYPAMYKKVQIPNYAVIIIFFSLKQKKTTISLTSVTRKEHKPKPEQPKKKESQVNPDI
jgi:hypothetical protein